MHHLVLSASTYAPLQGITLLLGEDRTIDELITAFRPLEPEVSTAGDLLHNAHILVQIAKQIGSTDRDLRYLRERRSYLIGLWLAEKAHIYTLKSIVPKHYFQMRVRLLTLCEIYDFPLAENVRLAIMAE